MTQCMAWFDESGHIISKVSHILGQDCSSPLAFDNICSIKYIYCLQSV